MGTSFAIWTLNCCLADTVKLFIITWQKHITPLATTFWKSINCISRRCSAHENWLAIFNASFFGMKVLSSLLNLCRTRCYCCRWSNPLFMIVLLRLSAPTRASLKNLWRCWTLTVSQWFSTSSCIPLRRDFYCYTAIISIKVKSYHSRLCSVIMRHLSSLSEIKVL